MTTLTSLPRSPSWARRATTVALLWAVAVLAVAPVHAQDPPPAPEPAPAGPGVAVDPPPEEPAPDAPPPPAPMPLDPSPHVRVLVAHFAIFDARDRLALEQIGLSEARDQHARAVLATQQAEQRKAAEEASLEEARHALREFSVGMFIHANGGVTSDKELAHLSELEHRKAKQLTDAVREHRLAMVDQAEARVDEAVRALEERQREQAAVAEVVSHHEGLVGEAEQALRDAERELREAQRADVLVPFERDPDDDGEFADPELARERVTRPAGESKGKWELTIEGRSIFTSEELAAWFATFQVMPTRARATPEELARWFIEEGEAEGLRGDVAFAQAILETGSFTNLDTIDHNNFAGIGHCDSCPSGWHFDTPQLGVRAQIQLLKSYVYERPEYVNELVDRRLRGPAGCCQTWNELSGVWASANGYGAHIMRIYQQMLEWLYERRTGLPAPTAPAP